MFEVNGTYANRVGTYVVLALNPPRMRVRYADGDIKDLNIGIQERIWENILAEQEAARQREYQVRSSSSHKLYLISLVGDELAFPSLETRTCVLGSEIPEMEEGDRIIFYHTEARVFFAAVTVTAQPKIITLKTPRGEAPAKARQYPVDIEAQIFTKASAISVDSVELESWPNYKNELQIPGASLSVSEDDFELLVELLAEVAEREGLKDSEIDVEE